MIQETHHLPAADPSLVPPDPEIEETARRLEGLVVQLERLIDGRSADALQRPGKDGRWGVVEVLCHLRDWELVVHDRVRRIVEEDAPALAEVDATMWPLEHEYRDQDSIEVFTALAGHRRALVAWLREAGGEAWNRGGILETGQAITIREIFAALLVHDEHYLREAWEAVG